MNIERINRPKPPNTNNVKPHPYPSPLPELCACAPEEALVRLEASKSGLTQEQVKARLEQYGPNEVTHEKPPTWYEQLFHAFLTPFNGVLFAVSVVSLFSDVIFAAPEDRSFRTIIVLATMILLSTLLRFWQEFRSNKAAEELKAMVTSTAAVVLEWIDLRNCRYSVWCRETLSICQQVTWSRLMFGCWRQRTCSSAKQC
jgi:magnesium-transporting ATPase (P-type)